MFATMIGTGLRVGEATGLRWCDVDFENRRNTTKENWDPKESKCYRDSTIDCEPFQDLFLKNVELELKVLRDSIRNKAIDSYITWDKCIMSQISIDHPIVLNYIVVIDGDDTDRIEDILSSVANKKAPRTNELAIQYEQQVFSLLNSPERDAILRKIRTQYLSAIVP